MIKGEGYMMGGELRKLKALNAKMSLSFGWEFDFNEMNICFRHSYITNLHAAHVPVDQTPGLKKVSPPPDLSGVLTVPALATQSHRIIKYLLRQENKISRLVR